MAITIVGYPRGSSYLDPFVGVRLTLEGSRLRIGSARGCDVRLPDLGVSPRHATIVGDDVGYNLIDENSEHGTSVGGRYLTAGKPYLLRRDVERVLCGSIWVTLLPRSPLPVDDAPARAAFTRRLLRATLQRLGYRLEATVTAIEGPSRHERLVLPDDLRGETIVFGRAPSAGFRLRDHQASRGHFQIGRDDHDALWVRDLGSTNGTLLAGEPLLPHVERVRLRRPRGPGHERARPSPARQRHLAALRGRAHRARRPPRCAPSPGPGPLPRRHQRVDAPLSTTGQAVSKAGRQFYRTSGSHLVSPPRQRQRSASPKGAAKQPLGQKTELMVCWPWHV
ncbi:MAG: FHA domain-containing protein [Polyangiaceae bacterium]|nr:FHA domain-containing protein [Polyangiaceae bacterium]